MKAEIKYPGSKWSIADWIIGFFPEHHSYLEPFFGSGAVLFRKERSNIETVNDLDDNVINLFECIKNDTERLIYEVYYTPYARKIYENAYKRVPDDNLGRALNFLIRLNMGHGYRTNGEKVGYKNDIKGRERAYAAQYWSELPERLPEIADRLRGVQIECQPAVEIIRRYNDPKVLIYCDPPYVLRTRNGKQYRCEMDDNDHMELLETILLHKGPLLISGYDNPFYNEKLKDWYREETTCYSQVCSKKREVLWMNFEPVKQLTMFR